MLHCVIFNSSHEPLAVVSAEEGLVLTLKGKAYLLECHPERKFRTVREEFPAPTSVILKEYRKTGGKYYGKAQLNQRNLLVRDDYTCQYCGRHTVDLKPGEYPTRDHVLPQSRGGQDIWTNVVLACSSCNHRKDNKTPEEADMQLLRQPKEPTVAEILGKRSRRRHRRR